MTTKKSDATKYFDDLLFSDLEPPEMTAAVGYFIEHQKEFTETLKNIALSQAQVALLKDRLKKRSERLFVILIDLFPEEARQKPGENQSTTQPKVTASKKPDVDVHEEKLHIPLRNSDTSLPDAPSKEAHTNFRRALSYINGGDLENARNFLEAAIKIDSQFQAAKEELERIEIILNCRKKRNDAYEHLLNGKYTDARVLLNTIRDEPEAKQTLRALDALEQLQITWELKKIDERSKLLSNIIELSFEMSTTPLYRKFQEKLMVAKKQENLENMFAPSISLMILSIITIGFSLAVNWDFLTKLSIYALIFFVFVLLIGVILVSLNNYIIPHFKNKEKKQKPTVKK